MAILTIARNRPVQHSKQQWHHQPPCFWFRIQVHHCMNNQKLALWNIAANCLWSWCSFKPQIISVNAKYSFLCCSRSYKVAVFPNPLRLRLQWLQRTQPYWFMLFCYSIVTLHAFFLEMVVSIGCPRLSSNTIPYMCSIVVSCHPIFHISVPLCVPRSSLTSIIRVRALV